jgi:hypothetical protein
MLEPSKIAALAADVADLIERCGAEFTRGDPRSYFAHLSRVNSGLTLSIVPQDQRVAAISLKNLYVLWNILVDDDIDRKGTRTNLDASLLALVDRSSLQRANFAASPSALNVLARMFADFPAGKTEEIEAFCFDLWEVASGFVYEHCINEWPRIATAHEYEKYSVITATVKTHLDIDWMFLRSAPSIETYKKLRLAYDHFSRAIKYSSDIGSLRRDLLEENNLSIVRIGAVEDGILGLEEIVREEDYGRVAGELHNVVVRIERMVESSVREGRAVFAEVSEIDVSSVVEALSAVVTVSRRQDLFFQMKAT